MLLIDEKDNLVKKYCYVSSSIPYSSPLWRYGTSKEILYIMVRERSPMETNRDVVSLLNSATQRYGISHE